MPAAGHAVWLQAGATILAGSIFCAFFYWRYADLPPPLYALRDDGIITLSHARNLADYGLIGVSPSGGRVEGFSAPLQFLIFFILYSIGHIGYQSYGALQTLLCSFALGALFYRLFCERPVLGLALTAASALFLSYSTSFIEWHGSGMENAITHVFFLAVLVVLFQFARNRKVRYGLAAVVVMASVSRVESIYYVAPLLTIFSLYWRLVEKDWAALKFSLIVAFGWVAINLGRYLYFGDLNPNTAYAEYISPRLRLQALLTWSPAIVHEAARLAGRIFADHGGLLLLAVSPLILFVRRERSVLFLFAMLASLILNATLNPFVFGPARLDPTRLTTFVAVAVAISISALMYYIDARKAVIWLAPALIVFAAAAYIPRMVKPYGLCCGPDEFIDVGAKFAKAAERENLPRPTVADADLGVISWHKQFNIVDLGLIGSTIMARLSPTEGLANYLFDIAAPDLIELHSPWSCMYFDVLLSDTRFGARYAPVPGTMGKANACGGSYAPSGIWIRRDVLAASGSPERRLIDDLQALLAAPIPNPGEWRTSGELPPDARQVSATTSVARPENAEAAIARLAQELSRCRQGGSGDCIYVARTAYRFLPEFRAAGRAEELRSAFEGSPIRDYDLAWLGYRDGTAQQRMLRMLRDGTVK